MRRLSIQLAVLSGLVFLWAYSGQRSLAEEAKDEAMLAGVSVDRIHAADENYYIDMDYGYRRQTDPSVNLSAAEVRGRNTWIAWTFGNDRFWDYMSNHTFGAFDLLKVVSSDPDVGYCGNDANARYDDTNSSMDEKACKAAGKIWIPIGRNNRWSYYGLVNEPCFAKATAPDEYGLWLDMRVAARCVPRRPIRG